MPTYSHMCTNLECKFEWEDFYSIKQDPPKSCPTCKQETVKRLIDGGVGKGIVELTGQELVNKVQADGQKLKRDVHNSEKLYSNVLGESHYQKLQTSLDKRKR